MARIALMGPGRSLAVYVQTPRAESHCGGRLERCTKVFPEHILACKPYRAESLILHSAAELRSARPRLAGDSHGSNNAWGLTSIGGILLAISGIVSFAIALDCGAAFSDVDPNGLFGQVGSAAGLAAVVIGGFLF